MTHPKTVIEQVAHDLSDFVNYPEKYPVTARGVSAEDMLTLSRAATILNTAVARRASWEAHSLNTDFAWLVRQEDALAEADDTNQPPTERTQP